MYEYNIFSGMAELIFAVGVIILLVCLVNVMVTKRKSQNYRKLLTDLYVAAKTRFLAKEEGLDLDLEYELLKKWDKKQKIKDSELDLDGVIEEELKERVAEPKESKKK